MLKWKWSELKQKSEPRSLIHELKIGGKYEPNMSHVHEWTSERDVHICPALVSTYFSIDTCAKFSIAYANFSTPIKPNWFIN